MSLDFYYSPMSAPCRAVMLTAEAIGVTLNYNHVDIVSGEAQSPEYEQINPQKTVPFLIDDDYKLSESRAIMCYLCDQYSENHSLYPTTLNARASVNRLLHFDVGTLYKAIKQHYFPGNSKTDAEDEMPKYEKLKDAFAVFDKLLEGHDFAAGRNLTIADLSLISSVTTAEACGFEVEAYKNVNEWAERVKSSAPGYRTANGEGVEMLKKFITPTEDE